MKQIKYYSKKNLESMVQTFNKKYGGKIKTKQNKLQLYNNLKKEMSGSIQVPKCIMRKLPNINKDDIFKVNGPTNKGEWLSTVDIDNIMTQYENLYENFMYLGTVPIDFKKIYPEIFNINMNKDNHNMYGLILNTDPSTKSGPAANGHLEVVQWLHENHTEGCTEYAMNDAASRGHLEVVMWLKLVL